MEKNVVLEAEEFEALWGMCVEALKIIERHEKNGGREPPNSASPTSLLEDKETVD